MKQLLKQAFKAGNNSAVKPRKLEKDIFVRFDKWYTQFSSKAESAIDKKDKLYQELQEKYGISRIENETLNKLYRDVKRANGRIQEEKKTILADLEEATKDNNDLRQIIANKKNELNEADEALKSLNSSVDEIEKTQSEAMKGFFEIKERVIHQKKSLVLAAIIIISETSYLLYHMF